MLFGTQTRKIKSIRLSHHGRVAKIVALWKSELGSDYNSVPSVERRYH
jgi:hypothetical protein